MRSQPRSNAAITSRSVPQFLAVLLLAIEFTGVIWLVLFNSPIQADVPQQQPPPISAIFDWPMPDRFGLDEDNDGLIDYFTAADKINPSGWRVDFDACGSTGGPNSFEWTISGTQVETLGACDGFSYTFPRETFYQVSLTVRDSAGNEDTESKSVVVQDWLIVAIGDSFGSGEGSPDIPTSRSQLADLAATWAPVAAALEAAQAAADALEEIGDGLADLIADIDALTQLADDQRSLCDARAHPSVGVLGSGENVACVNATSALISGVAAAAPKWINDPDNDEGPSSTGEIRDQFEAIRAQKESYEFIKSGLIINLGTEVASLQIAITDFLAAAADAVPVWQDAVCRRSARSSQAQAALEIERADPRTSVTFVHLSCRNATIEEGIVGPAPKSEIPEAVENFAISVIIESLNAYIGGGVIQKLGLTGNAPEGSEDSGSSDDDNDRLRDLAKGLLDQIPQLPTRQPQIVLAAGLTRGREIDALLVTTGAEMPIFF